MADPPRTMGTAGGLRRQVLTHTPLVEFRKSLAPGLPLRPQIGTQPAPHPLLKTLQHRRRLAESKIPPPTSQIDDHVLHHLLEAHASCPAGDLPYPLLETANRLRRNSALRLFSARKAESETFPLPRPRHGAFLTVHLELELNGDELHHALHHPLPRPLAANVDITVIRIPHEAMVAPL